jgi:hypothetical protein
MNQTTAPPPTVDRSADERTALGGRATRVMARARLQSELRSIVFDLLGCPGRDELPPAVAAWVDDAADTAVAAVCDPSLRELIHAVDVAVADAPRDVVHRLSIAAMRRDAGFA